MSDLALRVEGLSKRYSNNLQALKSVSLQVEKGDFFALLGTNGAGKTTLIGIVCGLVKATGGEVEVFGIQQKLMPNQVKRMVGLMPQEFNFNQFEPVEEILLNQAGYYGITKRDVKAHCDMLLKKMQLWDKRHAKAQELSGGMKRRLMLARALIHQPKLLILDEPTAGVDVEIRRSMWSYFQELNEQGVTIILTTHYLEEAENLCHHIALLNKGVIGEQTSMKELLKKIKTHKLVLDTLHTLPAAIDLGQFNHTRIDDTTLEVELPNNMSFNALLAQLSKQNIEVMHIHSRRNRLEMLFDE